MIKFWVKECAAVPLVQDEVKIVHMDGTVVPYQTRPSDQPQSTWKIFCSECQGLADTFEYGTYGHAARTIQKGGDTALAHHEEICPSRSETAEHGNHFFAATLKEEVA